MPSVLQSRAHHPIVVGTSSCLDDGTYSVNWTISNSESSAERYMLIKAFTVTPNVGTTKIVFSSTRSSMSSAVIE